MYEASKVKEASSYLQANKISGRAASTLALKNKFGIDYDTLVKQLQSAKNTAPAAGNNTPAPKADATPAPANNVMKTKNLDDAGKKNLDSQLDQL